MDLNAYLDRIRYLGVVRPDLATLRALHRAHLMSIPYENLDIHLGRRLTLDEPQIFAKLVGERRGGWCYEMNGLFAWALRMIGFRVSLLSGAVNRAAYGDAAEGNHLVLLVELDRPYLADVGFGNGFLEPLPLAPGRYRQGFLTYQLAVDDGARWHFTNHQHGGPGYDMLLTPHQLADFAGQCQVQQTSPNSGFVRTTACHRHMPGGVISLRGAVLTLVRESGVTQRTITSADEYVSLLEGQFGLSLPQAAGLWDPIWRRHQAWREAQATGP